MLQDADANLRPQQARSHNAAVVRNLADTVLEFAEALNNNTLQESLLPRMEAVSSVDTPAANIAATLGSADHQAQSEPVAMNTDMADQGLQPQQTMLTDTVHHNTAPLSLISNTSNETFAFGPPAILR